uniref:Uncharacterized protein n=1 Tax=Oryza nivara TaxID=4536 RepID=A0A0E0IAF3_ORYNI
MGQKLWLANWHIAQEHNLRRDRVTSWLSDDFVNPVNFCVKSMPDQVQEQPTQECNPDSSANEEERGCGPGPARRSSRTKTTNSRYYGPTWAV